MNDTVPICPTHDIFFECPECSNQELETQQVKMMKSNTLSEAQRIYFVDRIKELEARETELVSLVETIRNNLHPKIEELEAQVTTLELIEQNLLRYCKDHKIRIAELEAQLEQAARYGYRCGYEAGHNDTVESVFSLDAEIMAEEWWMLTEDELQQVLEK